MNWDSITAISEIIGAIAVIVTLIYLARQIAMSNKFAKAEAWQSRFAEFSSLNAAYGVNPIFYHAMSKIHTGGCRSFESNGLFIGGSSPLRSLSIWRNDTTCLDDCSRPASAGENHPGETGDRRLPDRSGRSFDSLESPNPSIREQE